MHTPVTTIQTKHPVAACNAWIELCLRLQRMPYVGGRKWDEVADVEIPEYHPRAREVVAVTALGNLTKTG